MAEEEKKEEEFGFRMQAGRYAKVKLRPAAVRGCYEMGTAAGRAETALRCARQAVDANDSKTARGQILLATYQLRTLAQKLPDKREYITEIITESDGLVEQLKLSPARIADPPEKQRVGGRLDGVLRRVLTVQRTAQDHCIFDLERTLMIPVTERPEPKKEKPKKARRKRRK